MSNTNRHGRPGEWRPYNDPKYKRIARLMLAHDVVCARCGRWILAEITERARHRFLPDGSRNPDHNHPFGGTVGHVISLAELRAQGREHEANEESNLQPEHRTCNSSHGAKLLHRINRQRTQTASRDW